MLPVALVTAIGILAIMGADRSERAASSGQAIRQEAEAPIQSLSASEKVALFADIRHRAVIEGGKIGAAEAMIFAPSSAVAEGVKAAPALDVIYGANMGVGARRHAILLAKSAEGKTVVLADSGDWKERAAGGGLWSLFLRPGEAEIVARAARVEPPFSAAPRLTEAAAARMLPAPKQYVDGRRRVTFTPKTTASAGRRALLTDLDERTVDSPPVLRTLIEDASELGSILIPVAGFVDDKAEANATAPADALPDALDAIREEYKKASQAYYANDIAKAASHAPNLAPAVEPLKNAGYALASAQILALLAKVGAPVLGV